VIASADVGLTSRDGVRLVIDDFEDDGCVSLGAENEGNRASRQPPARTCGSVAPSQAEHRTPSAWQGRRSAGLGARIAPRLSDRER
jgi:hypothetical protein